MEVIRLLQELKKNKNMEVAQKAKINGLLKAMKILNFSMVFLIKKRSCRSIRGVLKDGVWIESPQLVKEEFYQHFKDRFEQAGEQGARLDMEFVNCITSDQNDMLEGEILIDEVKKAVWDYGIDKTPRPDGFTFGFFRRYWKIIEGDVVNVVKWFFSHGFIPKGCNSAFVTLIPKILNANMVKDFRPISLIGSVYKIIAKILENRLSIVLGDIVNEIQSAFVAKRYILDSPFILNKIVRWCSKKNKQAMVFKVDFEKAYDSVIWDFLDDILLKFGFGEKWRLWIRSCLKPSRGSVLVNGSLTKEFQFYKGLKQGDPLSPFLFILVMESLHISFRRVVDAGLFKGIKIGHSIQISHLFYVDDAIFMGDWCQSNIDTITRVLEVLKNLESIRARFFNGAEVNSKKSSWVRWKKVKASKDTGGLGVSRLFDLNRALMFKWIWRFIVQKESLWARVISALHGEDGKIGKTLSPKYTLLWLSIVKEVEVLKSHGIDLLSYMKPIWGNGVNTSFWNVPWRGEMAFKVSAPRIYMLESMKGISVADKLAHDRWSLSLNGLGEFTVASVRRVIDDNMLPTGNSKTRWIKEVPIKINIHAWKVKSDCLPTRVNMSRRGIDIESISCPLCNSIPESSSHLFFACNFARDIMRKIHRWWEVDNMDFVSYEDWLDWLGNTRLPIIKKRLLEGIHYIVWCERTEGEEYRKWYLQMTDCLEEKIHVVLKETGVFEKKNINPAKYKISFKVVDEVPKQGGVFGDCGVFLCMFLYRLANGIPLALDDPF
uniref:RNA-directed DNA polymerase, eukaryota n=1 Tax=Tanacetum cinerariifolium TaxID=118510 RepID=A0A699HW05_TANCI|nr:RNA-directed DNA polymerase, eukaryota [Tanacetum cinerariifolium]